MSWPRISLWWVWTGCINIKKSILCVPWVSTTLFNPPAANKGTTKATGYVIQKDLTHTALQDRWMFIYSVSLPLCVCTAFQLPPPVQHTTQLSRQVLAFYSNRGGMIRWWKYGNPQHWCQPQLTPHLEPRSRRMFACDGATGVGHDPNRGWMDVPGSTASIIKESQVLSPDGQELLLYCTVPGLSAPTNPHWYISEGSWPPLTCWDKTATSLLFKIRMQNEGEGEVRSVEQHFPTESLLYLHECCLALLCQLTRSGVTFQGRSVKGLVSSATALETRESVGSPWLNPMSWKNDQSLTGPWAHRPGAWHQIMASHSLCGCQHNVIDPPFFTTRTVGLHHALWDCSVTPIFSSSPISS